MTIEDILEKIKSVFYLQDVDFTHNIGDDDGSIKGLVEFGDIIKINYIIDRGSIYTMDKEIYIWDFKCISEEEYKEIIDTISDLPSIKEHLRNIKIQKIKEKL